MRNACGEALAAQHVPGDHRRTAVTFGIRVSGTDTVLHVPAGDVDSVRRAFESVYRERFGTAPSVDRLVIATVNVVGDGAEQHFDEPALPPADNLDADAHHMMWTRGAWQEVPVYRRERLGRGAAISGPAIVVESSSTTVVDAGWRGENRRYRTSTFDPRPRRNPPVTAAQPT